MKAKQLGIFAIATLAVVIVAFFSVSQRDASLQSSIKGQRLYPDLHNQLNNINAVEISRGSTKTSLIQKEDRWFIKEKYNYPADFGKIKTILLALADLELFQKKTNKPEKYAKLGVEDPEGPESTSTRITLFDPSHNTVASTLIGNSRPANAAGREALYVRKNGDPQSWLVYGKVSKGIEIKDWIDSSLADLNRKEIKRVVITQPDGTRLEIRKETPEEDDFQLLDLPEGYEVRSLFQINQLAAALEKLQFVDVLPAIDFTFDQTAAITSEYETFNGLVITIESVEQEGKWHIKLTAGVDENRMNRKIETSSETEDRTETSKDVKKTPLESAPSSVDAAKAAKTLTERVEGWVYILPNHKAQNMTKKLSDVIKENPE